MFFAYAKFLSLNCVRVIHSQANLIGPSLSTEWLGISAQLSNGATETLKKVKEEHERKGPAMHQLAL
ncbi:MAG: hypothetical protein U1B30_13295, partial [Pseudomonadota bacterium]|nr:hypothetical protein [Pseudomonadota bacterium]